MKMELVTKILEMVGENKLTAAQASELLQSLHFDMTVSPAGKAKFASVVNLDGGEIKRRVHVTVRDSATDQQLFELISPLDEMLRYIDHFLQLVADNEFESLVLDGTKLQLAPNCALSGKSKHGYRLNRWVKFFANSQ